MRQNHPRKLSYVEARFRKEPGACIRRKWNALNYDET